jgi:hypothetical protein
MLTLIDFLAPIFGLLLRYVFLMVGVACAVLTWFEVQPEGEYINGKLYYGRIFELFAYSGMVFLAMSVLSWIVRKPITFLVWSPVGFGLGFFLGNQYTAYLKSSFPQATYFSWSDTFLTPLAR